MQKSMDLIGKTISGIVAAPAGEDAAVCIWMLQFTDGSHVEFVSPHARRALSALAGDRRRVLGNPRNDAQLALNVA